MGNAATTEGETEYAEAQAEIERLEATPNLAANLAHFIINAKSIVVKINRNQSNHRMSQCRNDSWALGPGHVWGAGLNINMFVAVWRERTSSSLVAHCSSLFAPCISFSH